jgi:hypothetical protein
MTAQTRLGLLLLGAACRVAAADPIAPAPAPGNSGAPVATPDPAAPDPTPETDAHPARRTRDATLAQNFHGPFQSSRLFDLPTADVVGAYVLSVSGDGSLLQQPGVLTSATVLAIGFGDIAQLEYRQSAAISVTGADAPIPAVGVQLKVPIPAHSGVPAIGLAFRLGVPRTEQVDTTLVAEKVTDLYIVGRLRFDSFSWLTLHGGVRASSASITLTGDPKHPDGTFNKTLYLPAGGYEIAMNSTAKIIGEIELAPQFSFTPGTAVDPKIGYAVIGRFGLRWSILPSVVIDSSIGYQLDAIDASPADGLHNLVQQWDIRLGAEVFVPWGALACRAVGVFCE